MSKLNASAFEFVPGRGLVPVQSALRAPIERPEQTEAPPPPPTISLSIGGPKPPHPAQAPSTTKPPAAAETPPASTPHTSKPGTPKPQTTIKAEQAGASSKTFTTEKAKTDTHTIAQEVKNAADEAVLEDLYGNGTSPPSLNHLHLTQLSQGTLEYCLHWSC